MPTRGRSIVQVPGQKLANACLNSLNSDTSVSQGGRYGGRCNVLGGMHA